MIFEKIKDNRFQIDFGISKKKATWTKYLAQVSSKHAKHNKADFWDHYKEGISGLSNVYFLFGTEEKSY